MLKYLLTPVLLCIVATAYGQSKTYFISPAGHDDSSGRAVRSAWKSLEKVNQVQLQPGDQLLFESAATWFGQLQPKGSGTAGKPIILSSYGDNGKPVINIGRAEGAGIRLTNQSWWEIKGIEITSGAAPELGIGRQGIVAIAKGENQHIQHIVVRDCYIHDIWGQMGGSTEYTGYYSCGILVNIQRDRGRDRNLPITTSIDEVLIENNRIERFDKCGIISWGAKNNVIVRNNTMDNLGGDGIFVNGPYRGLIERNIVNRSCMRAGSLDIPGGETWWPHVAAVWIQNTFETIMQYNEVYNTGREKKNGDGTAYDFDFNCRNCICQYNYSQNNFGFLLIMNETFGNIARYNISENDRTHLIQFQCDTTDRNLLHNNVFYIDYGTADLDYHSGRPDKTRLGASMNNNIFYATGQGRFRTVYTQGEVLVRQYNDSTVIPHQPNTQLYHNLYFGPWKNGLPDDAGKIVADPLFIAPGTGGNGLSSLKGYKLKTGSPAVNAGILMPWNTGTDFFGNPVNDGAIDFGAFEQPGSGVFADSTSEPALNRVETGKRSAAWLKRLFPATIQQPSTATAVAVSLKQAPDSGSRGSITLVIDQVKARSLSIVPGKKVYEFAWPANKPLPSNTVVHVVIQMENIKEEWNIPVTQAN